MSLARIVSMLGLLISLTNAAYGDLAPIRSGPKRPIVAPVKVVEGKVDDLDPNAVAKIVIPSNLLSDLQEPSYSWRTSNEFHLAGTTIAGLALAAAAMSLMFVDRKSPYWKMGVIGLFGCVLFIGLVMLADFAFPPKTAPPADQPHPQRQIVIDVQKDGHEVILVLPGLKD